MFRIASEAEYEELSEGGTRFLFRLDHFAFLDAIDDEGELRHVVLEDAEESASYEVDQGTMYECMARFLAGEYEKIEYGMGRSPAQESLLDLLEEAAARARSGEDDFTLDELEGFGEPEDTEAEGLE